MKLREPKDLFFDQLRDLYSAESQIFETLPDLEKAVSDSELKVFFSEHRPQSSRHVKRLLGLFQRHDQEPGDDVCKAIEGLIEGGNAHLVMAKDPITKNLLCVAHTSRIKHYEIAAYQFAYSLARALGMTEEAGVLKQTLEEEEEVLRVLMMMRDRLLESVTA